MGVPREHPVREGLFRSASRVGPLCARFSDSRSGSDKDEKRESEWGLRRARGGKNFAECMRRARLRNSRGQVGGEVKRPCKVFYEAMKFAFIRAVILFCWQFYNVSLNKKLFSGIVRGMQSLRNNEGIFRTRVW